MNGSQKQGFASVGFPSYRAAMSLGERTRPGLGIIEPCLPSPAKAPPSGPGWLHEIKHDGFRIMARRDSARIRLITRNGNDFTNRFPIIVAVITALPARSFLIDGEAIVTNGDGLAVFDLIRHNRHGGAAVLCAFDLIELDGDDLRRSSIEYRKRKLAKPVRRPELGIVLNEHYEGEGEIIFRHACKLGCEGIVSKRLGSHYRSGRSAHWIKVKNPKAPTVRREAEEDWRRWQRTNSENSQAEGEVRLRKTGKPIRRQYAPRCLSWNSIMWPSTDN